MIFRISGSPRELLAATPIFREWKRRELGSVLVETFHSEILADNKYVDEASKEILDHSESVVDFDMVEWWKRPRPVTETYATFALRDLRLGSWGTEMYASGDMAGALRKIEAVGGRVALVGDGVINDVCDFLHDMGYNTISLSGMSLLESAALARYSELYVGNEGDEASVVLTSNIPAVVLWSWMSPEFFKPFRRGVPYEAVRVREEVCKDALLCSERGVMAELGKVYGPNCTHKMNMWCLGAHMMEDIIEAVGRVVNV